MLNMDFRMLYYMSFDTVAFDVKLWRQFLLFFISNLFSSIFGRFDEKARTENSFLNVD